MARKQSDLDQRRSAVESPSHETVLKRRGYCIDKLIGYGSYADVYKLSKEGELDGGGQGKLTNGNEHSIACKIIDAAKAPKEYVARFLPRELEILRNVSHPNIIHIVSIIQRSTKFFIFMRYAERGDLLEFLLTYGHLSERQSRIWFRQITLALAYLHSLNISHRDVKCENILVTKNYNLKLTDFGFARFTVDSAGKSKNSQTFCGSLGYAPPEILKGKGYDPKAADMWSTGIVLFVMLNRSMPFFSNSVRVLYKQQVEQKWQLNQNIAKLLSEEVKRLLSQLLVPIPKRRFAIEQVINCDWFRMDKRILEDPHLIWIEENVNLVPLNKNNKINMEDNQDILIAASELHGSEMFVQPSNVPYKTSDLIRTRKELRADTMREEINRKSE